MKGVNFMDWDVRYIGLSTYYKNKNTVDLIEWCDDNIVEKVQLVHMKVKWY